MSPEFLEKRLFRPFQTTKQQGIGIGMFQSKMIVEAHGGELSAESEEGKEQPFQWFCLRETIKLVSAIICILKKPDPQLK